MLKKILIVLLCCTIFVATIGNYPVQSASGAMSSGSYQTRVIESDDSGLTVEFTVRKYTLETRSESGGGYDRIYMEGVEAFGQPGFPQIPFVPTLIGVPPGAEIKLNIVSSDSRSLGSSFYLAPAPIPVPIADELTPGGVQRIPDEKAYKSTNRYPETFARIVEEAWLRDRRLVKLELFPFQYVSATGELFVNDKIRVRVDFVDADLSLSQQNESSARATIFDNGLENLLLNFRQAKEWTANPANDLSYAEILYASEALPGPRYRIGISKDGIYRLTYASLLAAGLDLANIDPETFKIENQGDEIAIYIRDDGTPGIFEEGDFIAFYGQKFRGDRMATRYAAENEYWYTFWRQLPDGTGELWKPEMNAGMFEKYTDENVYWLSYGGLPGLRMQPVPGTPGTAPVPGYYTETVHMEQDNRWRSYHFTSTETWFWEFLNSSTEISRTYTATLDALSTAPFTATLRGEIVALSTNVSTSPDHQVSLYLNDANQSGIPVHQFQWDGGSMYHFEAGFDAGILVEGENLFGLKVHDTPALFSESMFFDWFEISYPREFQAISNQLTFSMQTSGPWKYTIDGYTAGDLAVLKISDPLAPEIITDTLYTNGTLQFEHNTQTGDAFVAESYQDLPATAIKYYQPPSFDTPADYIFITHSDFISGLQPLAAFRASQGLSTLIIDVQDLYNQFNDGIYNPIAVKNFLSYTFANWQNPPTYVLLVGDGHWNFKGSPIYNSPEIYMPPNLAWVDPWQGEVDSLNLLATVIGDDPLADVLIGRLPVNNQAELASAVNKTIAYESSAPGAWSKNVVFVADNSPDPAGDFPALSEDMISTYLQGTMEPLRIYEDDFGCSPSNKETCSEVNHAITTTLNTTGTLMANYIGHGSVNRWSHEEIFVNQDIDGLTNIDQLPIILSMTCLDGYWLHPGFTGQKNEGIIEDMVRAGSGGAVAAFSPTGLGVATGHDSLHRGFYDSLFVDGVWNLGLAAQSAKLRLYASGSNYDLLHTFTIFGDPALHISSPYNVNTSPSTISRVANSGESVAFPVNVTNTGLLADQFEISVTGTTWPVTTTLMTGILEPGEFEVVNVILEIPQGTPGGQLKEAIFTAGSLGDVDRRSKTRLITLVAGHQVFLPEIPQDYGGG